MTGLGLSRNHKAECLHQDVVLVFIADKLDVRESLGGGWGYLRNL